MRRLERGAALDQQLHHFQVSASSGRVQRGFTLCPPGTGSLGTDVKAEIEHETNGGDIAGTREVHKQAAILRLQTLRQHRIARADAPRRGLVPAGACREERVVSL